MVGGEDDRIDDSIEIKQKQDIRTPNIFFI